MLLSSFTHFRSFYLQRFQKCIAPRWTERDYERGIAVPQHQYPYQSYPPPSYANAIAGEVRPTQVWTSGTRDTPAIGS